VFTALTETLHRPQAPGAAAVIFWRRPSRGSGVSLALCTGTAACGGPGGSLRARWQQCGAPGSVDRRTGAAAAALRRAPPPLQGGGQCLLCCHCTSPCRVLQRSMWPQRRCAHSARDALSPRALASGGREHMCRHTLCQRSSPPSRHLRACSRHTATPAGPPRLVSGSSSTAAAMRTSASLGMCRRRRTTCRRSTCAR
jgi:hypothetical protein